MAIDCVPITSETRAEIVAAPGADNSMLYIPASSVVAESIWKDQRSKIKDQTGNTVTVCVRPSAEADTRDGST